MNKIIWNMDKKFCVEKKSHHRKVDTNYIQCDQVFIDSILFSMAHSWIATLLTGSLVVISRKSRP